jgi:hypothetical protein
LLGQSFLSARCLADESNLWLRCEWSLVFECLHFKIKWGLGVGEQGKAELVLSGYRVSVWEDEKTVLLLVVMIAITVWLYLTPLNCTLKNGEDGLGM